MKSRYTLALLALVLSFSSFRAIQEWVVYTSKEGGYKISMPAAPTEQNRDINTAIGNVTMYMAMLEGESTDDNLLYMSAYAQYPADKISSSMTKEEQDRFFKGAAEGSAKSMNGKVDTIMVAEYKGYPSRKIHSTVNFGGEDYIVHQQLILVKNNFYMLQTLTKMDKDDNAGVKKFLNSFSLVE